MQIMARTLQSCVTACCPSPVGLMLLQYYFRQEAGIAICSAMAQWPHCSACEVAQQAESCAAPGKLAADSSDALRRYFLLQAECGAKGDPMHKRWRLDKKALREAVRGYQAAHAFRPAVL